MNPTTRDGLLALRAAQRAFELAGNRYLANCAREWISEVEEEIKSEDKRAKYESSIAQCLDEIQAAHAECEAAIQADRESGFALKAKGIQ